MKKLLLLLLFYSSFNFLADNAFGKRLEDPPIPHLYVKPDSSNAWETEFKSPHGLTRSKYKLLKKSNNLNNAEFLFTYEISALTTLLTESIKTKFLFIYFATVTVPESSTNLRTGDLVLLFAEGKLEKDISNYYLLEKGNPKPIYISRQTGLAWIKQFDSRSQRYLRRTLNPGDSDNYPGKIPDANRFSDTRYTVYCSQDFKEATVSEAEFQHGKISAIGVKLGTYGKSETDRVPLPAAKQFRGRLMVIFHYLDKSYNQFIPDFSGRGRYLKRSNCEEFNSKDANGFFTIDNGQLCPYYCPDEDQ